MTPWLANHRGPYLFIVTRPHKTKAGFLTSQTLDGLVDRDDAEDEAHALLTDPRDTINHVYVWSVKEEQFIGGFK